MKHRSAYKICVFLAIIGLGIMYASSLYISPEKAIISEIDKSWSGKNVEISGKVISFSSSGKNIFMRLNDSTGDIKVVQFESEFSAKKGEKVNVTGTVELYQGELEIIAEEIQRQR